MLKFEGCKPGANRWAEQYFHDCVYDGRDYAGFGLGLCSILVWLTAQLPQFISNIKNQSSEALSIWFLVEWFAGDTLNLLGCLIQGQQLPTTTMLAMYFVLMDVLMLLQYIYYGAVQARRRRIRAKAAKKRQHHGHHHHRHHHGGGAPGGGPHSSSAATSAYTSCDPTNRSIRDGGVPALLHAATHSASGRSTPLPGGSVAIPAGARTRDGRDLSASGYDTPSAYSSSVPAAGRHAAAGARHDTAFSGPGTPHVPPSPSPPAGLRDGRWRTTVAAATAGMSVVCVAALALQGSGGGLLGGGSGGMLGRGGGRQLLTLQQGPRAESDGAAAQEHAAEAAAASTWQRDWAVPAGQGGAGGSGGGSGFRALVRALAGGLAGSSASGLSAGGDPHAASGGRDASPAAAPLGGHGMHCSFLNCDVALVAGTVMGYLSTCFYLASRVSQIRKNLERRSTEGLSRYMFLLTITANLCTGLSILLRLRTVQEATNQLPWMCGTFGTIALDVTLFYQVLTLGSGAGGGGGGGHGHGHAAGAASEAGAGGGGGSGGAHGGGKAPLGAPGAALASDLEAPLLGAAEMQAEEGVEAGARRGG